MFRIVVEEGNPQHLCFMLCDNPRCVKQARMPAPPGATEMQLIQAFFGVMTQQHKWLVLPHGHYCPEHKGAFLEAAPASLIVPATAIPPKVLHL
jgi:hypothetical protein